MTPGRWISAPWRCRSIQLPLVRIITILLLLPLWAVAEDISIRMEGGAFLVTGWSPPSAAPTGGWAPIFSVYAGAGDVPAMLGSYSVEKGSLWFRPRFPLAPGM